MKKILTITCIAFLSILNTKIIAQSQEDMQKMMDYMTPGEMHKWLAKADGTWNEQITMWMDPNAAPMQMTASCETKMILNGLYQQSISTGSFNGMPFEGHNLVGYDNIKKVFQSTWVDNMGTGVTFFEGPYDAATKTITLTGKMMEPGAGKEISVKETIQFVDDNTQIMTMYQVTNGKEVKSMEIKFTRKM
jgi:hypothetical protein